MPRITAIKPQRKRKNRFSIYLDGKFAFGLSAESLAKANLGIDHELSPQEIDNLILESKLGKALDRVYRFLSYRPRSEKEIRDYLKKKGIGDELLDKIIAKIQNLGYLNDLEFARWWVEQRSAFRPRGLIVLRLELREKGVAPDIIDTVLNSAVDEASLAQQVAQKGARRYRRLPMAAFRQKMVAYLRRRGFSWATIKETLSPIDEIKKSG